MCICVQYLCAWSLFISHFFHPLFVPNIDPWRVQVASASLALSLLGLLFCHVYTTPETIDTGERLKNRLAETGRDRGKSKNNRRKSHVLKKNVKVEDVEDGANVEVGASWRIWRVDDVGSCSYKSYRWSDSKQSKHRFRSSCCLHHVGGPVCPCPFNFDKSQGNR